MFAVSLAFGVSHASETQGADKTELVPVHDGKAFTHKARRLQDTAFLLIDVKPAHANVMVDQRPVGKGRVFLRLDGRRWRLIEVSAPGFKSVDGYLELREKEIVNLELGLRPISGMLTVITEPPGAVIKLDDAEMGTTPTTLRGLPAGVHGLSVEKGAFWWSENIDIQPDKVVLVDLKIDTPNQRKRPPPPPSRSEPRPEPTYKPEPRPEPEPSRTASESEASGKPDCRAVCDRFLRAVSGSDSLKQPIRRRCEERCEDGDLRFSVCAWKARTMDDVSTCMSLP